MHTLCCYVPLQSSRWLSLVSKPGKQLQKVIICLKQLLDTKFCVTYGSSNGLKDSERREDPEDKPSSGWQSIAWNPGRDKAVQRLEVRGNEVTLQLVTTNQTASLPAPKLASQTDYTAFLTCVNILQIRNYVSLSIFTCPMLTAWPFEVYGASHHCCLQYATAP